jgi:hypothetical protein
MSILKSPTVATDKQAQEALRQLFNSISLSERKRIYDALYTLAHGESPPQTIDWSDNTKDGPLKSPSVKAAGK